MHFAFPPYALLLIRLYLGALMVAKLSLALNHTFPSSEWNRDWKYV